MNMERMLQLTAFRINAPRVVHQTIDGETIMIDFDSGAYYSTDQAGTVIWEQVDRGAPVDEIVQVLTQHYDGNHRDIETAVTHFLAELQQESLISPVSIEDVHRGANPIAGPADQTTATHPAFEMPILHKYTDMQDVLLLDPIHEVDEQGWPIKKDRTE
jgi:hypothetical protein